MGLTDDNDDKKPQVDRNINNVALVGASGNLGPSILEAFLQNGDFNITAISRKESKAEFPSAVKVIKTDLSTVESLTKAFEGQDAVVLIVGAEALAEQKRYIDAAVAAGVKRFIPSEFGSDLSDPEVVKLVPIFKPKVEATEYLKSKESDTFSWTSIATGPFFDWGLKVGFLGFNLKERKASIWDSGTAPFSASNLSLIGEAVVRVLSTAYVEDTKNKTVYVESHTTTQKKILAELEKQCGKDNKWTVEKVDGKKVFEDAQAKIQKGDVGPHSIYPVIQALAFADHLGKADHSKKSWNGRLELSNEDFANDIKAVLKNAGVVDSSMSN